MEDSGWSAVEEPTRELEHALPRNWWCVIEGRIGPPWYEPRSALPAMLHGETPLPGSRAPSAEDLAAADAEVAQLMALGSARDHLAELTLEWARARPTDPEVAEALARVVEGGRWDGCTYGDERARSGALSKQAFQTLHRFFPKSEWTERTPYWYP
jgi:hypothetical protein